MRTFFILSLPRSRTAWLANFLTYGGSYCFHEGLVGCRRIGDLAERFSGTGKPIVGNSDCGNLFFVDQIIKQWPEARLVFIERDYEEVLHSLDGMGPMFGRSGRVEKAYELMERARAKYGGLNIHYDDMDEQGCREIYKYCTKQPFDFNRWQMLDGMNIQIDEEKKLNTIHRNVEQLNELMAGG